MSIPDGAHPIAHPTPWQRLSEDTGAVYEVRFWLIGYLDHPAAMRVEARQLAPAHDPLTRAMHEDLRSLLGMPWG